MKDIGAFALALFRHWKALLTSGLLAVALIVLPAWKVAIPPPMIQSAIVLALLAAAFGAWKDEHRKAVASAAEAAEAKAALDHLANAEDVLEISSSGQYWTLVAASKYGLHRRSIPNDRYGGMGSVLFLGEIPVDYKECHWLYQVVDDLTRRGALKADDGVLRLTDEARQAIRAGKRSGRVVGSPPTAIVNVLTGETVILRP